MLLSQHSEEGYRAANNIMAKLMKKKTDNEELRNPSGFIHTGCASGLEHGVQK